MGLLISSGLIIIASGFIGAGSAFDNGIFTGIGCVCWFLAGVGIGRQI